MTKVEIREQRVPLSPQAQGDQAVAGYEVRINGAALPVAVVGYEVGPSEAGTVVTLVVPADDVAVRKASAADEETAQTWQSGGRDPRADIPGWTPEVARG